MEQSYVSAAFFRHLTKERLQRHQAEQLLADGGLCMLLVACMGSLLYVLQHIKAESTHQKAAELEMAALNCAA